MRKLYKNVFSVLAIASSILLSQNATAQFGCGSGVVLSNGYTATGITTPGTGGAEDWNTNPTGTSINSGYWDDDVYLFEYTATAPYESISMTIYTRNTYTGIGIFDNCTGTSFDTEFDAAAGSSSSNISLTVSANITAGNTVYIAVGQWGTPNDLDFDVTDFTVTAISCPDPSALMTSNITSSSADLGWTENGSGTMWNVEYGTSGFTQGSGTMVTGTTTNPLAVSSLMSNTSYEFYVQTDCGGGDMSNWVGPFSFTTLCGIYTPAYTEDFTNYVPACWSEAQGTLQSTTTLTGTSSNWTSDGFGNSGTSGAARINIYGTTSSNDEWLISPSIDLGTGNTYQLDFDVALTPFSGTTAATMDPDDSLALVISLDDGATWDRSNILQVWTAGSEPSNTGDHIVIDLSAYSGVVKFGFYGTSTVSGVDINAYIDNFHIDVPPACAQPTSLMATNITSSSADLGWTETGTATMWNVEYGAAGFTPGSGTMVTGTTTNPLNVTSLMPNTIYDFYVQADCGSNQSGWVGPYSFTTPCATIVAPWTESFDATTIPSCWSMAGPENWLFTTSWQGFGASGISDHTGNSGSAAGVDGSGGTNAGVELFSPMIDISGLTQPTLDFYYFSYNEDFPTEFNSLLVDVWDGASWVRLDSIAHHDPDWQYEVYYLNAYLTASGDIQVRFTVDQTSNTGSAFYNDQMIDDVSIYNGPSCPDPSHISATWIDNDSVIIDWMAGALETDWNIELGATGFTPGTSTGMYSGMISTNSLDTIGGLTELTTYDVYIQADCGGGDMSTWVGPFTFTTAANCASATGFTATSIQLDSVSLSWTPGSTETEWIVEYGMAGFTPGTGTQVIVMNNPSDTIVGLAAGTNYDFYLLGVCNPTDTSLYVGPATVMTPISNDASCSAITVPVDGITYNYTNVGSTTETNESANTYAYNNSIWFEFIYPANTLGVNIATCGSSFDTKLAAYTTTDCADFTTYTSLATNDDDCGLQSQVQICGTPGDRILIQVGSFSSSTTAEGDIQLTVTGIQSGTDASVSICSVDTINLNQLSAISNTLGNWTFSDNPNAIVDDSLFNASVVVPGQNVANYIISSGCIEDTTVATITILAPANSGIALSPFDACNTNVPLFSGLTGTVDMGGTWNDDSNTGLLVGNTFVAFTVPDGTYPFTYTVSNGVCAPSSTTVDVTINDCTGLEENSLSFEIYPNPSRGEIFIANNGNNEIISVEVVDLQGRVVFNNRINLNAGSITSINLEELNSGMYTVKLVSNESAAVRSIVIE